MDEETSFYLFIANKWLFGMGHVGSDPYVSVKVTGMCYGSANFIIIQINFSDVRGDGPDDIEGVEGKDGVR